MLIMLFAAAQASSPVPAAPVYLACDVGKADSHSTASIAVDERNQRVTVSLNGRPARSLAALFTADQVRFSDPIGGDSIDWTISRVDLTVRQTATFSPIVETGTCRLVSPPAKRAF